MANVKSNHLNDPQQHILVAQDGQPREARYRTVWDDGTETETLHMLSPATNAAGTNVQVEAAGNLVVSGFYYV